MTRQSNPYTREEAARQRRIDAKKFHRDRVKLEAARIVVREQVRTLRKYANGFKSGEGYNLREWESWTPKQKRKIRETHDAIVGQISRPFKFVRTKDPKKLKAMQEFSGQKVTPKNLKGAFIPTPVPEQTKVRVRTKVSGQGKRKRIEYIPELTRDGIIQKFYMMPKGFSTLKNWWRDMRALIRGLPKGRYFLLTGEGEWAGAGFTQDQALNTVQWFIGQYFPDREDDIAIMQEAADVIRGFRRIGSRREDTFREQSLMKKARGKVRQERYGVLGKVMKEGAKALRKKQATKRGRSTGRR